MTTRVLGVGVGLFVLIAIWLTAVVLCIVARRTNKNITLILVAGASCITIILILIPRESQFPAPVTYKVYDEYFVRRVAVMVLLGTSACCSIAMLTMAYVTRLRLAKPLQRC